MGVGEALDEQRGKRLGHRSVQAIALRAAATAGTTSTRSHSVTGAGVVVAVGIAPSQPRASISWCTRRSEEHTSELQSLMRISYAVFCLKKKKKKKSSHTDITLV